MQQWFGYADAAMEEALDGSAPATSVCRTGCRAFTPGGDHRKEREVRAPEPDESPQIITPYPRT
jgi:hypothetical protein